MKKRDFMGGVLGAGLAGMLPQLKAQTRPVVQLVVPFAAGGVYDIFARLLASTLQRLGKQTVVVVNRPGAGGIVAAGAVVRSRPDEAIFMLTSNAQLMQPMLASATQSIKDTFSSLRYACVLGQQDSFWLVPGASGIRTAADFSAKYRNKPMALNMGSQGAGSVGHLLGAALAHEWQLDTVHVPYNGSPAIARGLLSGDIDYAFMNYENFRAHLPTDAIVPLAVASDQRSTVLPSVPSASSLGLKSINHGVWFAMTHAAHADYAVVNGFVSDTAEALMDRTFLDKATEMGLRVNMQSGEKMQKFMSAERQYWSKMIANYL